MKDNADPRFIPLVTADERRAIYKIGSGFVAAALFAILLTYLALHESVPLWAPIGIVLAICAVIGLGALRQYRKFIDDILIFDGTSLTLVRRSKVVERIEWTEIEGYDLNREGDRLSIHRTGKDPFVLNALRESRLPTLTTVVKIMDALDQRMPPTARRERGLGKYGRVRDLHLIHGDRPPTPELVPGTAYRYIDPIEMESKALDTRKTEYSVLLLLGVTCIGTLPGSGAGFAATIGAVTAIVAWIFICVVLHRERKDHWVRFRRTVRATILAVEDGIKFSGDPRIYRRLLTPRDKAELRSPSRLGVTYETYAAGRDTVLVARRYLEPADLPLTALSPHSSNDLQIQMTNHQKQDHEDHIIEC